MDDEIKREVAKRVMEERYDLLHDRRMDDHPNKELQFWKQVARLTGWQLGYLAIIFLGYWIVVGLLYEYFQ